MEKRERSFSALKFMKNYLRSTMTDERLNGLALLIIHSEITLDYDAVIDEFGKSNPQSSATVLLGLGLLNGTLLEVGPVSIQFA